MPVPGSRLRIEEAQQAEQRAGQAAARLRDRFAQGLAGQSLEPDVDRLEMAARELSRCVATANDAAAACDQAGRSSPPQIQGLQLRSGQMLETTMLIRRDGVAAARSQLNALLPNPAQP